MASSRKIALPLLVACTFTVFGCTTPKKAEVDAHGKPIEYVWITPTGSNIPVKVRKDEMDSYQSYSAKDQEKIRHLQEQAARTPQQNSGSSGP